MDGFTFYKSFYETMKKIRKRADRANTALAVLEFMFDDEEPQGLTESCEIAFESFRRMLEKSKHNAGRGGRPLKENGITQSETELKPNGNRLKTELKPNGKQVQVQVQDKYIPPTVNAYAQERKGAKMAAFLEKYPLINPDSHIAGYDMDFELLTACFERSKKYLARKPHDLSWVAKNYHRIISGAFDDKWDDDGELTQEEIEANRRAFEEKYGATAGD
jgi:hypothetical protein